MIKFFNIITVTILLMLFVQPPTAYAEEADGCFDEIYGCIDDIMDDNDVALHYDDISGLDIEDIINFLKSSLSERVSAPFKMLCLVVMVVVITAAVQSNVNGIAGENQSGIFSMVCVITAVTVIAPRLLNVYDSAFQAVSRTGSFILVFVPLLAGITVASGGITAAGSYDIMILGASELLVKLTECCFMPVISAVSALAVSGSVFANASLDKIVELLKKAVIWGLTVSITLFTGFVALKCTLGGKADSAVSKTAKFVISGFVPIVGSAVTDAYSTVRGSFDVIRCTVGAGGVLAIAVIMLPPILEIVVYRLVMNIGTAAAELFSVEPVKKLLKTFDSGLAISQSLLICYSVMFILCTGILMNCVN